MRWGKSAIKCIRLKLFWLRGFHFTHETVREWSERFAPEFAEQIRNKRQQTCGRIWSVDETYVRSQGRWCYLYRGIDEYGNLLDVRLSEQRDLEAAKVFFEAVTELIRAPRALCHRRLQQLSPRYFRGLGGNRRAPGLKISP